MNDIPIPLKVLSTEEKEDGVYVTAEVPRDPDALPIQWEDDVWDVPSMSRDEMNAVLEREGLSVRLRTEPKTTDDILGHLPEEDRAEAVDRQAKIYAGLNPNTHGMFKSYFKQETVRGPSRDRSLSGKARRKARKDR